jgi:N-acylglucosamine 2-epimerase
MDYLTDPTRRAALRALYQRTLHGDVLPFWLRHGMDPDHGGILTALDRDGGVLDTDKSVWFQGRAGWMFATVYNTRGKRGEYLEAALSCVEFLDRHAYAADGKLYFTVTREGRPLRMRRYVYSEAFAAIAHAALAKATGESRFAEAAGRDFAAYLRHSFKPGVMAPKVDPATRPMIGIGPRMIGIATAQELRANLGDVEIDRRTCTEWIDRWVVEIARLFFKPELGALLETVAPDGGIIEHAEGLTLNPGHALECAWFLLHEGRWRGLTEYLELGLRILDCMWRRGWDPEYGGLFYFRDLRDRPVLEYWQDMKFWWPHCEAIIAAALAHEITGDRRYSEMHAAVHDWSFRHFADPEHGEWYGWLLRDGSVSQPAKGSMFKGPFHLPRMLWYLDGLLGE